MRKGLEQLIDDIDFEWPIKYFDRTVFSYDYTAFPIIINTYEWYKKVATCQQVTD